ncbi:MAG TPA: IS66 family transposase, partial [Solirubrobacteraceae bacterium]|nr:IS66 family transposase [Solirubrobacteraceae bacterium]
MTEVETLQHELEKASTERDRYRQLYMDMLLRCKLLERGIVAGRKAERFTQDASEQLSMQLLGALLTESAEPDAGADADDDSGLVELADEEEDDGDDNSAGSDRPEPRRRPRGRRKLPEALPRVEVEVVPPEVQQQGLDAFVRIGEVVSEVVERRPASLVAVRIVRPKFVRKDVLDAAADAEDAPELPPIVIAEPPERPIERGLAGPGLLAATIVQRWGDHLPANRQEAIYAREGLPLARSTICSWHQTLADLAEPLIQAMRADAFKAPYLCVDATGVLVQAKEQCQKANFWVVVAPERHVLYGFSHKHDSEAVDRLLKGYKGYLVADAHAVYDHLYSDGDIVESGCWAHCRRYFFKALGSEPELAKHALGLIKALFKIEKALATAPRKKREAVRAKQSRPIVDAFFAWCDEQAASALEGAPLATALTYARNQRHALRRFLDDGRLPIHNNISEGALRREAVGRKNWIFVGSDDGAHANTVFVSLLASCQMHGIEPLSYLRDLLCLLPSWPRNRVLELAPAYWEQTLKQE